MRHEVLLSRREPSQDEGLVKVPCSSPGHAVHCSVFKRKLAAFDGMMQDLLDRVVGEAVDVKWCKARAQPWRDVVHQKNNALLFQRRALPDAGLCVH